MYDPNEKVEDIADIICEQPQVDYENDDNLTIISEDSETSYEIYEY